MASIIDELVTILGFQLKPNTQQTIQKFEKGLAAIKETALVLGGAITAAAGTIAYFTEKVTTNAAELDKYSELTGASVQEMQRWGYAAEQAGGSAKSVKSDIAGLLEAMNPVMPGEFNQGLFLLGMYGQKYKDTTEMVLALSDKLRGMNPMEQIGWARKAGISNETLLLLKRGRSGINELMKQTPYLMGKEQTEAARKFEAQINRVKYNIGALGDVIITKMLPTLIKLVDRFEHWVASSKVNDFIQKMIDILSDPKLVGGVIEAALYGIIGATIILEAKWLAISAAIGLAVLGIQDFIDTSNGVKNTAGNKIMDWINDKPEWLLSADEVQAQRKRIAEREAAKNANPKDKSALLKIYDTAADLLKNMNNAPATTGGVANTNNAASSTQSTNVTNNVTNNIQVDGSGSPYQTGQEINYQLGRVQWGDLGPARR